MSSPPISAHEDDGMSASDIILKLSNIESYYGPIQAIRGISLEVPRPDRHAARRQRRRQDHRPQDHFRHPRSPEGLDRISGQADPAHGGRQDRAAGLEPRAGGARGISVPLGA